MAAPYAVSFAEHRAALRDQYPRIAHLLGSARARAEADAHAFHDERAIAAQRRYKWWMRVANASVAATSVLGAFSMASLLAAPDAARFGELASQVLASTAALSAACGAVALYKLREGRLIESWMTARAHAETHRLGYFTALAEAAAAEGDPQSTVECLDYVACYHLDVQLHFYGRRSREHEHSANVTVTIGAVGAGIATFFGLLGAVGEGVLSAAAAVSVTGAATGAYAASRELMNDDRRNAERYCRTWVALQGLAARLDEVKTAARRGNHAAMIEFVAAINEQVSLEHRQWLEGSETTAAALGRLSQLLSEPQQLGRPPETPTHPDA
jgi:hypothetical protein